MALISLPNMKYDASRESMMIVVHGVRHMIPKSILNNPQGILGVLDMSKEELSKYRDKGEV